jgi:hypothetical protein
MSKGYLPDLGTAGSIRSLFAESNRGLKAVETVVPSSNPGLVCAPRVCSIAQKQAVIMVFCIDSEANIKGGFGHFPDELLTLCGGRACFL